ncbi:hypothetical protein [Streptomyces sp. NPDC093094]|uniref:hypothetical protein n=1 Tax=Streptomyces sp. NPDC093094 TaxID=3366026 RepID=UPI00382B107A
MATVRGGGIGREEPKVGEQRNQDAGPHGDAGPAVPLPDLSGMDLTALRALDHPELSAAVHTGLRHPGEFREVWYDGGGEGGTVPDQPAERRFSAGLGAGTRGRDDRE